MKNSKLNVLFTFVGVLFVIGSLVAAFFAFMKYISNSLIGLFDESDEYLFDDSELAADDISIVSSSSDEESSMGI